MQKYLSSDSFLLALLAAASLIGIWHALPLVSVIADEMYYVGGVFRALEAKSLLPLVGDVPYGTLTFYLNYLLQLPLILGLLAWQGFHLAALKSFLVLHPEGAYLVPRLVSALIAIAFAWFLNRFLIEEGTPRAARVASLAALFLTVLPAVIFHTGKMWVLTFSLVAVSLLYIYRVFKRAGQGSDALRVPIYAAVMSAGLAAVNVLFAATFLIVIPLLAYRLYRDRTLLAILVKATVVVALVCAALIALNYHNIISLVELVLVQYHPLTAGNEVTKLALLPSIRLHGYQMVTAYPLAILMIVLGVLTKSIRDRTLFFLSLGYAALYFVFLSVSATWYAEVSSYMRYLFPFSFFFALMLASFSYERSLKRVLPLFLVLQTGIYLYMLFLLSVPTTLNDARAYITAEYGGTHALIYEGAQEVELPLNSESALALRDEFCGSKCHYLRMHADASDFVPLVFGYQSSVPSPLPQASPIIWVNGSKLTDTCAGAPKAQFLTGATDENYITVERSIGNYLLPDFWHLSRLGPNLYLYEISPDCFNDLRTAAGMMNTL